MISKVNPKTNNYLISIKNKIKPNCINKNYCYLPETVNLPNNNKIPKNLNFYPKKIENTVYDCSLLKIVYNRERTGFEETKDYQILIGNIIAGRYKIV